MVTSGGLVLPGGGDQESQSVADGTATAVSLARPGRGLQIGTELDWGARTWAEVRTRARRAGRAYVWLNLVEQRLRAVVDAVLRPVYEPVHGEEWVVAAAGPAGHEWVQRAAAVREVSRRKGYLLDPADDNVLSFLTLPQLRELIVQHWPCFEPYLDERRDLELVLDELEVARHVVSRNRALSGDRARPGGTCRRPAAGHARRRQRRRGRRPAAGGRGRGARRRPLRRRHRRPHRPGAAAAPTARRGPVRRRAAAGRHRHRAQPAGAELLRTPAGAPRRGRLPGAAALPQPGQQRGPPPRTRTRPRDAAS